ncbi:Phenylcoumaran benzylic ether reductase 1 [Citrus sinensis]|uniref:Phenylcoumaran benzylic ether reductase 1 n=1 Tax=Citrus sinensis TaxID=2711 RepID=A0ACB8M6U9_CITSI|nr:Phenylcoumaran benzylic ether reductase 1 [Citrus sinensis]
MEGENTKPKILIFGGTGYLGKYMVKASVASGHKTFVYARPVTQNSRTSKVEIHKEFQGIGVTIIEGELDEHEKIVSILKEVDVVISTVAYPQFLDQLKIVRAIKVAGNIKRFLPSEFGCEEDRVRPLPPFEACLEKKRIVRRAIEAAQIPYTFVSANLCGAYFVNVLLRPSESHDDVVVYGSGEAKALPPPEDIPISIIHSALAKGDLMNFELGEDDIEASMLYPDFKFTTIDQLLDIFLIDPPKPARTAFE